MNERIRELLAQHISPPAMAVYRDSQDQYTARVTYTVSQAEMNSLLAAVVEECATHIRNSIQTMERGKIRANVAHAATLIEEHFGIKDKVLQT